MGRKMSPEQRKLMSGIVKEWWARPGVRERMSLAHRGPKPNISKARLGKPHPHKRVSGWTMSEGGRKNISTAQKRYWKRIKKYDKDRYEEIRKRMSEGHHNNKR